MKEFHGGTANKEGRIRDVTCSGHVEGSEAYRGHDANDFEEGRTLMSQQPMSDGSPSRGTGESSHASYGIGAPRANRTEGNEPVNASMNKFAHGHAVHADGKKHMRVTSTVE